MTGGASSPDVEQNIKTSRDDIDLEPIPKKRKPRWASIVICLLTATGIIAYGFIKKTVLHYKEVNDLSPNLLKAIKNRTILIYIREEKKTYPVLFNLGLGLLAIILGTFVDRLSLVVEELGQFQRRYKRNIVKVFKSCFSGISWPAIIVIFLLGSISLFLARNTSFELGDLIYILGGIGVGPLITHLLNLNTQSDVDVSRLVEEKRLYPAYTIAWNYYFHNLKKVLQVFNESFTDMNTSVLDQGTDEEDAQPVMQLSWKKLILLIPHDCTTKDNLAEVDSHIRKITDIPKDGLNFPVYGLTNNDTEHRYVILYAKEPLKTLKEMSITERIKAVHENDCENQVMLLYRTLVYDILETPLDDACNDMCLVVPIKAENTSRLQNGGLVKLIMSKVRTEKCASRAGKQLDSFIKPGPAKKTEKPLDESHKKKMKQNRKKNIWNFLRDDKKNLDHAGGEISQNKEDNFQQQTTMLLQNEHEVGNQLERGKEPVHGKFMEKSKSELQKNSEASNSENREETVFREMDNDRTLAKSYSAPVSNDKRWPENQRNCHEKLDNDRKAKSHDKSKCWNSYKSDLQEIDYDDSKPSTSNQMEGNEKLAMSDSDEWQVSTGTDDIVLKLEHDIPLYPSNTRDNQQEPQKCHRVPVIVPAPHSQLSGKVEASSVL